MSSNFDKVTKLQTLAKTGALTLETVIDSLKCVFGMDELYTLAKQNSFNALNYQELLCNINYVLLTQEQYYTVWNVTFNNSLESKISAIARCFYVQASKFDSMVEIRKAAGYLDLADNVVSIAADTINAFESASKVAGSIK